MRVALLPTGPDPYLLAYWLRNYATWADAVDALHIAVCDQNDPEVQAYIRDHVAAVANATVTFISKRTDHGLVLDGLIRGASGLVVLCEDDAFVQQPQVMAECFSRIESGEADLVGCPRKYVSDELTARASHLWGEMPALSTGEGGWSFYPAFLFAQQADLVRVVGEGLTFSPFSGTRWRPGERIEALDMTAEAELVGDTFVAASFQLRAMGLRCETRPAFRASEARPDGPWFHVGSLSGGYGFTFLAPPDKHAIMVAAARVEPLDWSTRVAWWWHVWSLAYGGLRKHHDRYAAALTAFVNEARLPHHLIAQAAAAIRPLVTWAER